MKLLISKTIVGIKDRGLPTELRHTYAEPGDEVKVIFNNSEPGHFVCEKDNRTFVVFPSQYSFVVDERLYSEKTASNIEYLDDLLCSESAERDQDDLFD